jgi:REP element-mobilizing transposase RayT
VYLDRVAGSRSKQLELRCDKNGQRRGGKRPGAGRPKSGARASERHKKRPTFAAYEPIHIVMRAHAEVGSLRTHAVFRAIKEASFTVFGHDERALSKSNASAASRRLGRAFHIVHLSIQRTHIHMIVETSDRDALFRGMQAFGISAARQINRELGRTGGVFSDRYFPRPLKTPIQVRNCLAYVLNNWKHHRESGRSLRRAWAVDPYSTASQFDGWKEVDGQRLIVASGYDGPMIWWPKTWLLREGWRRGGLISTAFVPGGDE